MTVCCRDRCGCHYYCCHSIGAPSIWVQSNRFDRLCTFEITNVLVEPTWLLVTAAFQKSSRDARSTDVAAQFHAKNKQKQNHQNSPNSHNVCARCMCFDGDKNQCSLSFVCDVLHLFIYSFDVARHRRLSAHSLVQNAMSTTRSIVHTVRYSTYLRFSFIYLFILRNANKSQCE